MHRIILAAVAISTSIAQAETPDFVNIESIDYRGSACPGGSAFVNVSDDKKAFTLAFDDFIVASDESADGDQRRNCRVDLRVETPPGWQFALFCVDFRGYASLGKGAVGRMSANYRVNRSEATKLGAVHLKGPYDDDYQKLTAIDLNLAPRSKCGRKHKVTINTAARAIQQKFKRIKKQQVLRGHPRRVNTIYMPHEVVDVKPVGRLSSRCNSRGYGISPANKKAVYVNRYCRNHKFEITMRKPVQDGEHGLMTVDSLDGHVKQHYGVTWRRCRG